MTADYSSYIPPGRLDRYSAPVATVDALLAEAQRLIAAGEYLMAYDLADDAVRSAGRSEAALRLRYLRLLSLARAGARARAEAELRELETEDRACPDDLAEDIAALGARLAKDKALARKEAASADLAAAAAAYQRVFDRLGRPFAGVNASTLWYLSGHTVKARAVAARVLHLVSDMATSSEADCYWAAATEAEAALALGAVDRAEEALRQASAYNRKDYAARAATRRQLALLCDACGLDASRFLDPIANPDVLHYCGHIISASDDGRFAARDERRVAAEIRTSIRRRPIGHAHGSLAAGADILVAEACLEAEVALHVVIPFDVKQFVAISVRPSGAEWEERFHRCLRGASTVTITCDSGYLGDDSLFAHAGRVAMGQAINRSVGLASNAWQLAVWDHQSSELPAGTAHDIAVWRKTGRESEIISLRPRRAGNASLGNEESRRPTVALLFGDLQGCSQLHDEQFSSLVDVVLARIAAVIDDYSPFVLDRNTWGDGLFTAVSDVSAAARLSLDLQESLAALRLDDFKLPSSLRMRLAAHVGPVVARQDPVRRQPGIFGRELTRAARIEPRTPAGEVYATAAFAAHLALDPQAGVRPEYVGRITTAKGFEKIPMYVLKRDD